MKDTTEESPKGYVIRSVTPDDMDVFLKAFKEIFPVKAKSTAAGA